MKVVNFGPPRVARVIGAETTSPLSVIQLIVGNTVLDIQTLTNFYLRAADSFAKIK